MSSRPRLEVGAKLSCMLSDRRLWNHTNGGVVRDNTGNLYGAAERGSVLRRHSISANAQRNGWNINVLYAFLGQYDGESPQAGLTMDASGNLYGTTEWGQGGSAGGTVFELSQSDGRWTYHLLYTFTDRGGPTASLALDAAGNLYGTTRVGGIYGAGNVFKLTRSSGWTYTSLYDFTGGSDGAVPFSNLIFDLYGNILALLPPAEVDVTAAVAVWCSKSRRSGIRQAHIRRYLLGRPPLWL